MPQRSPSTLLLLLALACPVVETMVLTPWAMAQEATSLSWTESYVTAIEAQTELSLRQQPLDVPLTRIEFAQWLVEFFGYIPDPTQLVTLADVEPNSPDFQNAQAVVRAGVMRLYEGDEFRPQGDITKLEALAILVRALQLPAPEADPVTRWMALYADADQVPEVGHPFIAMAGSAGLLLNVPDPTLIAPNLILRRGDGAALLHQTLVAQRRIPPIEPPVAQLAPAEQPAVAMDPTQSAPPPVPSLPMPNGTAPTSSLISAFRVFPSTGAVPAGQQLQLGVQGIPGGLARAEIGGIGVIQLQETSPGLYEGTYTVTELNQPVEGTEVRVELLYNDQRDEAQQRFPSLSLGSAPPPPIPSAAQPTPISPPPAPFPAPLPTGSQGSAPAVQSNQDLGFIDSILLEPQRDLVEGDILTVQLRGRSDGVARFDLGTEAFGIPMRQVETSGSWVIYEGTYVVEASDRLVQPQLRIRLNIDGQTQEVTTTFPHTLDGSVGTRSTIQPPRAPISANPPQIQSISSNAVGVSLRSNDLLQVTVRGDRGARASFRVAGVIPDTEMREVSPGLYEGQVRIPPNPSPATNARLEVTLDRDGQRTIQADPNGLTISP